MQETAAARDTDAEIAHLRLEIQNLDGLREKAELALLQIQKDLACTTAIREQERNFAEQRVLELSKREEDLKILIEKVRKEDDSRIALLELELQAMERRLLDEREVSEAKYQAQQEGLSAALDSKQADLVQAQSKVSALSDRISSVEQERSVLAAKVEELKNELTSRVLEGELRLKQEDKEYERVLSCYQAEKAQLQHSLSLAAELESRQQCQIEELSKRARECETRERALEAEVQRLSILAAQEKEKQEELQRLRAEAVSQVGVHRDGWEAERSKLQETAASLRTEVGSPPRAFPELL